jgi:hypothetical protein
VGAETASVRGREQSLGKDKQTCCLPAKPLPCDPCLLQNPNLPPPAANYRAVPDPTEPTLPVQVQWLLPSKEHCLPCLGRRGLALRSPDPKRLSFHFVNLFPDGLGLLPVLPHLRSSAAQWWQGMTLCRLQVPWWSNPVILPRFPYQLPTLPAVG